MSIFGALGGALGTGLGMPWIGAIGTAIDGITARNDQGRTNAMNLEEAQRNRDFQDAQSAKQMAFQERMRSTQYQTAVKDMKEAGLNPMLAYSQGGAGTPLGASGGGSQSSAVQSKVSAGMSSARQSADTMGALQQMEMSKAQIEQVKAQTQQIRSVTVDQSINAAIRKAELDNIEAMTENRDSDTSNKRAEWRGIVARSGQAMEQYDSDLRANTFSADSARRKALSTLTQMEIPKARAESKFYDDLGKANPYLKQIMMMLSVLQGGKSVFKP